MSEFQPPVRGAYARRQEKKFDPIFYSSSTSLFVSFSADPPSSLPPSLLLVLLLALHIFLLMVLSLQIIIVLLPLSLFFLPVSQYS